jgi:ABC-type transporter MlaC component
MRRHPLLRSVLPLWIALSACAGSAAEPPQPAPTAAAIPASGPAAEGAAAVQRTFDEAAAITGDASLSPEAKRAGVEHLVDPLLDHPTLARAALGSNAQRFSPDQYSEFSHEYARFVTGVIVRRFAAFPGKASQVESASYDEQRGIVNVVARGLTDVTAHRSIQTAKLGEPIRLDLAMRERNGEWRIAGVKRGEVDVSRSFREQFGALLERTDPEGVITQLRERNRAFEADNPFAENGRRR